MSICSPALLYFIIGIISIISMIYSKTHMKTIAMQGLFIAIWTWFLNFLCSKGHEGISWFLVILPFVVMALIILALSNIIGGRLAKNKEMFSNSENKCKINPNSPGCPKFCRDHPTYPECDEYCRDNPTYPGCPEYCWDHPTDPMCQEL